MKKFFLFLILTSTILLRTWHGADLFFWNVDEDLIAFTVKRILIDHRIQLIGFPIPGGIYLGPLFYYLVSVPYFLFGMDPSKFFIASSLLGILTVYLVYKVGKIIFERELTGVLAALIYSTSFLVNVYSHVLTGLTIAPILALLVYLILYQNLKFKKAANILLLSLILLVASQNEGSSLSLIVLTLTIFLLFKIKIPRYKLIQAGFLFFLFHLPLLIFDLRHNFFLTQTFINFLSKATISDNQFSILNMLSGTLEIFVQTLARMLSISGPVDITLQILPCSDLIDPRISSISPFAFVFAIFILGFFILKFIFEKKKTIGEKIILLHLAILICGLFIFNLFLKGYLFEWILVIFFPAFALVTANFFAYIFDKKIYGKILVLLLVITLVVSNVKNLLLATASFGLSNKIEAVNYAVSEIGDREFELESIGSCFAQGYLYLFWYLGHLPTKSQGLIFDEAYVHQSREDVNLKVIMVNPSDYEAEDFFEKYSDYKSRARVIKKIDDIEILVLEDNKVGE